MSDSNKSLAEIFAENERGARKLTLYNIIIYVVLIVLIIISVFRWKQSEEKVKILYIKEQVLNDSLEIKNIFLDSAYLQLARFRESDSIHKNEMDSLKKLNPKLNKSALDSLLSRQKGGVIYLQYIDSYTTVVDTVFKSLTGAGYKIPAVEKMKRANFNSSVKYFNDEGRLKARAIADFINSKIDRYKKVNIRVIQQSISAAPGLVEVWLGEIDPTAQ